jgi:hypothetical protein
MFVPDSAFPEVEAGLPTTVTFVNNSPSLLDIRLCWSVGGTMTSDPPFPSGAPMPASNYSGVPAGGAAMLPNAEALTTGTLAFVAINANWLASDEMRPGGRVFSCADRLARNGSGTVDPTIVHPLASTSGIRRGEASIVVIGGCLGGDSRAIANPAPCGPGWDPSKGNLNAQVLEVARLPTIDAGGLEVQAAQLSPALAAMAGDAGVSVSFGSAGEAGVLAVLARQGDIEPPAPTPVQVGTDLAAFGQLGFGVEFASAVTPMDSGTDAALDAAAPTWLVWMNLAQAQSLVDPSADPRTYFGAHATYVVAILGDPTAASPFSDAGYEGYGLHLLVLPSQPQEAGP